jgi:hypothetical protein
MDKDELFEKFERNVAWLQRNIPPDDIYVFTEQTLMSSMYFLSQWSRVADLNKIAAMDPIAAKWIKNVTAIMRLREIGVDTQLDLGMEVME